MIFLQRPVSPSALLEAGKKATAKLKRSRLRGVTKFTFSSHIYAAEDVRKSLRKMHNGKCAFCEVPLPQVTAGHVEHFRPKGEVQQDIGQELLKPGYYWLAYDWSNLLLACEWCNTRAKRKLFPLADPTARARTHVDDLSQEEPLLLNPSQEDPGVHLEFIEEEIRARNASLKGGKSIEVYRLADPGLTEERRKKLHLFRALRILSQNVDPKPEVTEALEEAQLWEERIINGQAEYSAMLRSNL